MPDSDKGRVQSSKWADLGTRVASATVLSAVAIGALWAGGYFWSALIALGAVLMFWEIAPLCEPGIAGGRRAILALAPLPFTALTIVASAPVLDDLLLGESLLSAPMRTAHALALIFALALGALVLRSGRLVWLGYGLMVLIGAYALGFMRILGGMPPVLALVLIVVISDVAGYMFGRLLGGPKFWPRVSPKKTWSGTVAGWIGAALFGALIMPGLLSHEYGYQMTALIAACVAALLAFAGQMGDIIESAMKRHAGVKDSSQLIPGHGGVLDRFDALIAAAALAGIVTLPSYLIG
ncbi:MAG: phosphatidate cytidylyltransferase [Maritimibacter sp.]